MPQFTIEIVPKIIAVLSLLTMFFFFMRMYKVNTVDAKYYQNELTNVEYRSVSAIISLLSASEEVKTRFAMDLAAAERNNVYSAGQTNAELERLKLENSFTKDMLDKMFSLFSRNDTSKSNPNNQSD